MRGELINISEDCIVTMYAGRRPGSGLGDVLKMLKTLKSRERNQTSTTMNIDMSTEGEEHFSMKDNTLTTESVETIIDQEERTEIVRQYTESFEETEIIGQTIPTDEQTVTSVTEQLIKRWTSEAKRNLTTIWDTKMYGTTDSSTLEEVDMDNMTSERTNEYQYEYLSGEGKKYEIMTTVGQLFAMLFIIYCVCAIFMAMYMRAYKKANARRAEREKIRQALLTNIKKEKERKMKMIVKRDTEDTATCRTVQEETELQPVQRQHEGQSEQTCEIERETFIDIMNETERARQQCEARMNRIEQLWNMLDRDLETEAVSIMNENYMP